MGVGSHFFVKDRQPVQCCAVLKDVVVGQKLRLTAAHRILHKNGFKPFVIGDSCLRVMGSTR